MSRKHSVLLFSTWWNLSGGGGAELKLWILQKSCSFRRSYLLGETREKQVNCTLTGSADVVIK